MSGLLESATMPQMEIWMEYEIDRLRVKYQGSRLSAESRISLHRPDLREIVARLEIDGREFGIVQTLPKNPDKLSFVHFFLDLERRIDLIIKDETPEPRKYRDLW